MVGEIRDLETAEIAVQASLNGPSGAINPAHQYGHWGGDTTSGHGCRTIFVSSSLLAVMAQRLVRLLCVECREPFEPGENGARSIRAE